MPESSKEHMRPLNTLIVAAMLGQALLTVLLGALLFRFHRAYRRPWLLTWARSWVALCVYLSAGALSLLGFGMTLPATSVARLLPSLVSSVAGWWQATWLVLGAWELVHDRPAARRRELLLLGAAAAVGILLTLAFLQVPGGAGSTVRSVTRLGVRTVVAGVAFLGTAAALWNWRGRADAVGARLVIGGLAAYGLQQFHYAWIVASGVRQAPVSPLLPYTGIIDLLAQMVLGLGMVVWLLEQERAHAVDALAERERAEGSLRERERQLAALLEHAPAAIYLKDAAGRYLLASREFAHRHGLAPDAAVSGRTDFELFPAELASRLHLADTAALRSGSAEQVEESFPDATGEPRTYLASRFVLRDAAGAAWAVCGISTDTTARRQLEGDLRKAQRLESIGRLAGGIAHDFNNILTAIVCYADLARGALPADHAVAADIAQIRQAADRAANLTTQLLAFARRQVLRPRVLDLGELSGGMANMLRRLIGEHIELALHVEPGLWAVRADRGQMEQIVVNLAVNARDAMPRGGRLTLGVVNAAVTDDPAVPAPVPPGAYVLLSIADTGTGIAEEVRRHIFEPFYTTKPVGQGSGLGLATVHGIVEQSGGHIVLQTELGRGTRFDVYLPAWGDGADAVPHEVEGEAPHASRDEAETVLLVEDEQAVRESAARTLRAQGYVVLEAEDGLAGLELAQRLPHRLDVLVTDAVMPRMHGAELAERLTTAQPELRVLYTSGYAFGAQLPGMGTRRAAFLPKPFTPSTLARQVRALLDARELQER